MVALIALWGCPAPEVVEVAPAPAPVVAPVPVVDVGPGARAALAVGVAEGAARLEVDREGIAAGDELLVHQTVGAGAGAWARGRAVAVDGRSLTLAEPLPRGFAAPGAQVVVVQVAERGRVADLVVPAWDGAVGGVWAFEGRELEVTGHLSADGAGLRGGRRPGARHAQSCLGADDPRSAERGEGLDGEVGRTGFGAPSTGGGGGNCHNAGGGGGGNGGRGGQGGYSWVNEANGKGDVGGRGGGRAPEGLTLGGGGGAGQSDRPEAPGGAGGGAIWVRAEQVNGSGAITARGADGVGPEREGAGGGGAGGTLWFEGARVEVALVADGGRGADAREAQLGPGGGGGGGQIVGAVGAVEGGEGGVDPTGDPWGAAAGERGR